MPETAYHRPLGPDGRLVHRYGPRVHVLSDPWSLSLLARLSHPTCAGGEFHDLLHSAYQRLALAATEQLPTAAIDSPTRMGTAFRGTGVEPGHRVVVADVARAGMLPAHYVQRFLLDVMDPRCVRVDHLFMQRVADPRTGAVTGVSFAGSKIGGGVDDVTLVVPDPMAATGVSMARVLEEYAAIGTPRRIVTLHLIATPEYLRRLAHTGVVVYALRVDRGRSPDDVLATVPGERWDEESGLDEHSYIVPGAGGLGELISNSFV